MANVWAELAKTLASRAERLGSTGETLTQVGLQPHAGTTAYAVTYERDDAGRHGLPAPLRIDSPISPSDSCPPVSTVLDEGHLVRAEDRLEAIRRVTELRSKAQEMLDWLSEVRLDDPVQ